VKINPMRGTNAKSGIPKHILSRLGSRCPIRNICGLIPVVVCACLINIFGCSTGSPISAGQREPVLSLWWNNYKQAFITSEGRVCRPRNQNDTVSEGQAYAMLAAVFMNDRATFDSTFAWTDAHLSRKQRPNGDYLLAWHWKAGKVVDWMPASDADCDFALALTLALEKWGLDTYRRYARQVIADIMAKEVTAGPDGRPLLLPGLWGCENTDSIIQNPSYYNPAAFRVFYHLTNDKKWLELVETSYWVWQRSAEMLGDVPGAGLQPDWCAIAGDGRFLTAPDRSDDYGFEAVRMPMRIGLDFLAFEDRRGLALLRAGILKRLKSACLPYAVYTYQGRKAVSYKSLSAVAMAWLATRLDAATINRPDEMLLKAVLREDNRDDYYGQSLAGIGLCLSIKELNLHRQPNDALFQF